MAQVSLARAVAHHISPDTPCSILSLKLQVLSSWLSLLLLCLGLLYLTTCPFV